MLYICLEYTTVHLARRNERIDETQAGFRRNYLTTGQIFNLYTIVQKCLNRKGQKLYVAFVDFRKAFDSARHDKLLQAVQQERVKGKCFASIKSVYDSPLSCVRANNDYSDFFECPAGVRQGCVLSPTISSLFINLLAKYITYTGRHGIQHLSGLIELFILLFFFLRMILPYWLPLLVVYKISQIL